MSRHGSQALSGCYVAIEFSQDQGILCRDRVFLCHDIEFDVPIELPEVVL